MKILPINRLRRIALIGAALAAILLISVTTAGAWLFYEVGRSRDHNAGGRIITIAPGTSTRSIIRQLEREGVIDRTWPSFIWVRIFRQAHVFKAGDYAFKSPISAREALDKMLRGEVITLNFTIPEGYNRFDIARVLGGLKGLKQPGSPERIESLLRKSSLIADLDPQADSLEGYLFPDTYEYTTTSSIDQIVETMVERFRLVYSEKLSEKAARSGMTTRQIVTLASLIEKEAKVDGERELISSVFHQRLKIGMPLACDPTVIYAALLAGKYRGKIYQSDLDRESGYNTYKNAGLPPGPIASPGLRSLESALNPAQTDYLFFVVDAEKNDGSHRFSASLSDHEKAVRVLRQSERSGGR